MIDNRLLKIDTFYLMIPLQSKMYVIIDYESLTKSLEDQKGHSF